MSILIAPPLKFLRLPGLFISINGRGVAFRKSVRFPVMPLPEGGGEVTLSGRLVSTPPGALGLSLIRGPGES